MDGGAPARQVASGGLPTGRTKPARIGGGPRPERVSVERLPSTGATRIPPATATYDRTPVRAAPTSSSWPGPRSTGASNATGDPSTVTGASAPLTAMVTGASARSVTPVSVVSSAAAPAGLP